MSTSELTTVAVRFRLISLGATTLTIVTTVSVVSLSFCFILTAIEGTSRFAVGFSRLPAFEEPLAFLALLPLLVRLLVLVLLLFGECSFAPPPPDGFRRWPKLVEWLVSSLAPSVAAPADDERSFSRAAARSLDDLVVRIGCCGCCLTCCVDVVVVVGTTCFSSAGDRLVAARLRSLGFRDDDGG